MSVNIQSKYILSGLKEFNDILKSDTTEINTDAYINTNINTNYNVLNVKDTINRITGQPYKVVTYDKEQLCYLPETEFILYGLFRSVVINPTTNKIVAFSPPKSIPFEVFYNKYCDFSSDVIAEEFVEGTMINLFYEKSCQAWEISSRRNVGGTNRFFQLSTMRTDLDSDDFRGMFFEALDHNNVQIGNLNQNYCYSFVLQHPNNRIVVPFEHPQLYLVEVYEIVQQQKEDNSETIVNIIDIRSIEIAEQFIGGDVKYPQLYDTQIYSVENYQDIINIFTTSMPYIILGVIFKNVTTGLRTKVRNPAYEYVRQLRGNQPKLSYHYLCLRKNPNILSDFLLYYPEYKCDFVIYKRKLEEFTETLYNSYVSCYIQKKAPLNTYPKEYKTHMFCIHQKYLTELKQIKKRVTMPMIGAYLNTVEPALLMCCFRSVSETETITENENENEKELECDL